MVKLNFLHTSSSFVYQTIGIAFYNFFGLADDKYDLWI